MSFHRSVLLLALCAAAAAQQPGGGPIDEKPAPPSTPSRWFSQTSRTITPEAGSRLVVAQFPFRSPLAERVEWREFAASCACSHLEFVLGDRRYWLKPKPRELVQLVGEGEEVRRVPVDAVPVLAGEAGTVEVHIEMKDSVKRGVQVDIHTGDAEEPHVRLSVAVEQVADFVVTPAEVMLGDMTPTEQREFSVTVTSPTHKDFAVEAADQGLPGFRVRCEKALQQGIATWTIRGSYGPIASGKGGGGLLKFRTDVPSTPMFTVPVRANVAEPVEVTPGFVAFGTIRQADGKTVRVRFHANDGTDLQASAAALENLTVPAEGVQSTIAKDGKDVVVDLVVPAGALRGLLRGDLVVTLNHAAVAQKRVLFNGFVR